MDLLSDDFDDLLAPDQRVRREMHCGCGYGKSEGRKITSLSRPAASPADKGDRLEVEMRGLLILICFAVVSGAAPQSIRDIDWKNFSYPLPETAGAPAEVRWMAPDTSKAVTLIDGRANVPDLCSDGTPHCPLVTFDSVRYGDITGIKSTVAAAVLTYHSGGTANWQYVYVFVFESGGPRLLAWLGTV